MNKIQKPKIYNVQEKRNNDNDKNSSISTFENHRYVVIGPIGVGKTYYMLKILEEIGNKRPIHIISITKPIFQI